MTDPENMVELAVIPGFNSVYKLKKLTIVEDLGGAETEADFIGIFDDTSGLVIGDFNNDS